MNDDNRLRQWLADNDIDEVEAIVPDMAGVARGKFIPARKFAEQGGMRLPSSLFIQTVTGDYAEETVIGDVDEDLHAEPDLATLRRVPWAKEPTACVVHDCFFRDGSPVDVSPRQVLRNVLARYADLGLQPVVAPEVEFYLVQRNTDPDYPLEPPIGRSGRQESVRQPYSMDAIDEFEPLVDEIYDHCEAQRLKVDNLVHEAGTAQLEINFEHGEPLELADQVFLLKRTVRETAMRHQVYATFMAKPMAKEPGSSMHWHLSLQDASGRNIFSTADGQDAPEFLAFIGGLQKYLPQFHLLYAPYVNSYRRITRHMAAPINLEWGYDNRTVGLRVPHSGPENRRVESRLAGADANPYLAAAASLAAGFLGMEEGLVPGDPASGNVYSQPVALPRNLDTALELFQSSDAAARVFGARFVEVYAAIKTREFERFFEVISPWEREHLLLSV
ncbi:MAG: glutamine synthetase [Gammaproteobacteria bacterium]|nr:MAG: glutamine synthetase [Gammaproteobacteria bacterium]